MRYGIPVFNNISDAMVYATECQIATLEDLQMRKNFPKRELARHKRIADLMVLACLQHAPESSLNGPYIRAPRTVEAIRRLRATQEENQ